MARLPARLRTSLDARVQAWIRRRQGLDADPVRLRRGRIYILPTPLGIAYAVMLFAMVLGGMNYGNNLGLALAFLLASLGLVVMHHCHGTLAGLVLRCATAEPDRRVVVVIGDGAAQMTAQEISTLATHATNAIIIVVNNSGYTIERALQSPNARYNDIPRWEWGDLARALAPGRDVLALTATTGEELRAALRRAAPGDMFASVPDPGRGMVITCPSYAPGSNASCIGTADPRGTGVAIGTFGR